MVLPTWVVCVASVVFSVSLTLVNNALVRSGAVDAGRLTAAHAATVLACRGVGQRIRGRPRRKRPITNGAWGLLLVQAVAGVVQVFLWNRGIAGGATMADFQLYKLAAPLWSAVVQAALLDAGALTVTGWWSCAVSALGLSIGTGRGDAAKALRCAPFAAAACFQPTYQVCHNALRHRHGVGPDDGAWLGAGAVEVVVAAAVALRWPANASGPPRPGLLALSCGLAAALRWTTANVSVAAGGPVLYAILSPVKAGVALAAAALLVDRDAQALDAATCGGLAVCAAAAATFVVYGRRRRVAVIGAGGHAKVVIAALRASGADADVYDDDDSKAGTDVLNHRVRHASTLPPGSAAVLAVGDNAARRRLAARFDSIVGEWVAVAHPRASVDATARLGAGSVVLAGAVVGPDVRVGRHAIVNTRASVDHDCRLGDFASVAPGAVLCGGAILGEGVQAGAGCVVRDHVSVAAGAILGMGCVVTNSVEAAGVLVGVPARRRADLERRHTHWYK